MKGGGRRGWAEFTEVRERWLGRVGQRVVGRPHAGPGGLDRAGGGGPGLGREPGREVHAVRDMTDRGVLGVIEVVGALPHVARDLARRPG